MTKAAKSFLKLYVPYNFSASHLFPEFVADTITVDDINPPRRSSLRAPRSPISPPRYPKDRTHHNRTSPTLQRNVHHDRNPRKRHRQHRTKSPGNGDANGKWIAGY